MVFSIKYKNQEYEVELDDNILVGEFVIYFLQHKGVIISKELNEDERSWQLFSTSYSFILNQSFKEQARCIAKGFPMSLIKSFYGDRNYFEDYKGRNINLENSIKITSKPNKYTSYLNLIKRGLENYISILKHNNLEKYLKEDYTNDDFKKLRIEFDENGLFSHKIFKTIYIDDMKSCDEDPVACLNSMFKRVLEDSLFRFDLKFEFYNINEGKVGEFEMNEKAETKSSRDDIIELYRKGECKYFLKFYCKDVSVEQEFEALRFQFKKKLKLLNNILEKLSFEKRCYEFYDSSILFMLPQDYEKIMKLNLIPVDPDFYNLMEEI